MKPQHHYSESELHMLKMLSKLHPTLLSAGAEIINLQAILNLPKGCEHFISDVHGEHEAFLHILNSCSGVIRECIDRLFAHSVPVHERERLATLIYYPEEKLEQIVSANCYTEWPVVSNLFKPALWCWLLVTATVWFWYRRDGKKAGILRYPLCYFGTMLLGPTAIIRYVYPFILMAPFMIALMLEKNR